MNRISKVDSSSHGLMCGVAAPGDLVKGKAKVGTGSGAWKRHEKAKPLPERCGSNSWL